MTLVNRSVARSIGVRIIVFKYGKVRTFMANYFQSTVAVRPFRRSYP